MGRVAETMVLRMMIQPCHGHLALFQAAPSPVQQHFRGEGLSGMCRILFKHLNTFGFCPCQVVNPHLLKDLTERGLWNEEMKNQIIAHNGSIQVQGAGQGFCQAAPAAPAFPLNRRLIKGGFHSREYHGVS